MFFFKAEVSVVKLVKFRRDSGCLARDEFLVILKGDHILTTCTHLQLCYCWALYYTALRGLCGIFPVSN